VVEFRKKYLISLLLYFLIISLIIQNLNSQTNESTDTNSIIISWDDGSISHLQLNQQISQEIWVSDIDFDAIELLLVDDLNNDGFKEIIGADINRAIYNFDFETGEVKWKFELPSVQGIPVTLKSGDINGDNIKEIILVTRVPITSNDYAIFILNNEGLLIDLIESTYVESRTFFGADSIEIIDIDNDGINEIILSIGASLWNDQDKYGYNSIEVWKWNSTLQETELMWRQIWRDTGGNTQMVILNENNVTRIIVTGWFQIPIRAFSETGELIWNVSSIYNLENSGLESTADVLINIFIDDTGTPILLAFQNAYEKRQYLAIFQLNAIDGSTIKEPLIIDNGRLSYGIVKENNLYHFSTEYQKQGSKFIENNYFTIRNLNDKENAQRVEPPFGKNWLNIYLYHDKDQLIEFQSDEYGSVALDNKGTYHVITNKNTFKLHPPSGKKLVSLYIISNVEELAGEILYRHQIRIYISISIFILLIPGYLIFSKLGGVEKIRLNRINSNYKGNFTLFYYRLKDIFAELFKRSQEIIELGITTSLQTSSGTRRIEINEDDMFNTKKNIIEYKSIDLAKVVVNSAQPEILINWANNFGSKLKLVDLAILIEVLPVLPTAITYKDIVQKLNVKTPSTIYNRLNKLVEVNLLEPINLQNTTDNRFKEVRITKEGVELLKSLYITLDKQRNINYF